MYSGSRRLLVWTRSLVVWSTCLLAAAALVMAAGGHAKVSEEPAGDALVAFAMSPQTAVGRRTAGATVSNYV